MEKADPKELAPKFFSLINEGLSRREIIKRLGLTNNQYAEVYRSQYFMEFFKISRKEDIRVEQIIKLESKLWQLIENYNDPDNKMPNEDRAHVKAKIDKLTAMYSTFLL